MVMAKHARKTILKLALLLAVLNACQVHAVPVQVTTRSNDERHKACSLIFNIGRTSSDQIELSSISMPPLDELINREKSKENVCTLVFAIQPQRPVQSVQTPVVVGEVVTSVHEEDKDIDLTQPVYEQQLAVWPTDVDDVVDAVALAEDELKPLFEEQEVVYPVESIDAPQIPLYEDQLVIFPEIDFEDDLGLEDDISSIFEEDLSSWVTTTTTHRPVVETEEEPITVVESFHKAYPNGTSEYKLVLSTGLVNYKKIYSKKLMNGKIITVQEGYDSVPIPGQKDEFQTQYYIADENGHNVYKVEHNIRRPDLPTYLDYKHQIKNLKVNTT